MGPAGEHGLDLAQDAGALVTRLTHGVALKHSFGSGRGGYLYVIDGEAAVGETALAGGDAAMLEGPEDLVLSSGRVAELILVDVPLEFRPVGLWAS